MNYGNLVLILVMLSTMFMTFSCTDDDDSIISDSSLPSGDFMVERAGDLVAQNGTPTMGTVELGFDSDDANFLHFGNDFTTELGTGTVSVYLSTSDTFTADPGNGNPDLRLLGAVQGNGEQYFKVNQTVPSSFTHVIVWCNSAGIPFGYAQLN